MKRLLIIGCGDIALRAIPLLVKRYRVVALVRNRLRFRLLRDMGVMPVLGDLDDRISLLRLAGLADIVLHFAPPPNSGTHDPRTRHLLAALSKSHLPGRLIYISTSGVYGDCGGAAVNETRVLHPQTDRAYRRADAEKQIRLWSARNGVNTCILRVPGIYAADRLPLERIRQGTPAISAGEDSYTNHIHADDLVRIVNAAIRRGKPNRVYHASDDSGLKMGDYFDAVADAYGLAHPLRISRAEALLLLPESLLSFMKESRRLSNERMKRELKVALLYPTLTKMLGEAAGPSLD